MSKKIKMKMTFEVLEAPDGQDGCELCDFNTGVKCPVYECTKTSDFMSGYLRIVKIGKAKEVVR